MKVTGRIVIGDSSEQSLEARENRIEDVGLKPVAGLFDIAIGCVEDAIELKERTPRRRV